ncbi:MAG: AEC family transporter [Clostridia bacterium]|nr:AEC family transporter [Clostridia bacterium]
MFLVTLQQTAILLAFILIGYFLRKKDIITEGGKKVLAKLLTFLFAPCYTASSLSKIINVGELPMYGTIILAGLGLTIFCIFAALPLARVLGKDQLQRNILKYGLAIGNIGYFGYPIVYAIYAAIGGETLGNQMRAEMMMFCLPMTIAIYTYGYAVLTKDVSGDALMKKRTTKEKLSFLWSMPMIGTYAGIALGLLTSGLNFEMPSIITDALTIAGNCQSAPAMLLTGAVLAGVPFGKLFTSWKPYVIGVIRLLAFPLVVGAIFFVIHLCGVSGETFVRVFKLSIIVSAMPVGMNVVVFPESAGQDSTEGAKSCFISYILALGGLPLVLTMMDLVAKLFV